MDTYKVYIKLDENGNLVAINIDAFLRDFTDWVFIDEGGGNRYMHA